MIQTEQCMRSLDLANRSRIDGAKFRRRVAALPMTSGCELVAEMVLAPDPPAHIGAMHLRRTLRAIHRIGDSKVRVILLDAGMLRHDPRLRDLTTRERMSLAAALRRRAERAAA